MRRLLIVLALGVLATPSLFAQCAGVTTCTAAGLSAAQIQAALSSVNLDNTTVHLPAGSSTWTGTTVVNVSLNNTVTIQGAGAISSTTNGASTTGTDLTSITDNITRSGGNPPLWRITIAANKTLRITGIAFITNSSSMASNTGITDIRGPVNAQLRVDHCHIFVTGGNVGLYVGGALTGVADHDYFESASNSLNNMYALHNGQEWNNDSVGAGDKSWADTEHWGTSQFFFFEDSRFRNGGMGDAHEGARYVIRHSTATADIANQNFGEAMMYNHGLTSARGRSVRAIEVYQNSFITPGTVGVNHGATALNGGSLLFWGNSVTQYRQGIQIDYTRKDNGTYPYGTTPTGWGNCNGAGTFTAWDTAPNGYACLDGTGRGSGDLITSPTCCTISTVVNTTTGIISTSHQALSPIYVWNVNFTPAGGFSGGTLVGSGVAMLQNNRDYYMQFGANANAGSFNGTAGVGQGLLSARPATCTAGPGGNTPGVGYWATDVGTNGTLYVCNPTNTWTAYYTPYTYPHPLAVNPPSSSCAGGGSHTLADLNPATLQTCLNSVNTDGTTIIMPAGSSAWTTGVSATLNNSIVIQGAGAVSSTTNGASTTGSDQTTLLDHRPGSAPLFDFSTVAGKSLRITGIAFSQDTATGSALGVVTIGGPSNSVRVDHCHFIFSVNNVGIFVQGAVTGVADHNFFDGTSPLGFVFSIRWENGATWNGDTAGFGDKSWTDTEHWGSSQFFFVEDSRFINISISDMHAAARYVFRHNTVSGPSAMQMYMHGETPGNTRATRAGEIYANTFTNTGNNSNPPFSLNSGTALFWGNTVTGGWGSAISIHYDFRTTAGGGGNYNYSDSWHYCGVAAGGPTNWDRNVNSSGYACIDQPGRGAGDLLTGTFTTGGGGKVNSTTGTIAWPHQALSPIYIWNNIWTPQFYTANSIVNEGCVGVCANNRDYYMQFGTLANPGSFNGTTGVGQGLLSARPATCTAGSDPATGGSAPGVGYWATDTNTLYVCNPTNTWTAYYTPYTYPNPLASGGVVPPPPPNTPTSLTGTVSGSTVSLSWTASSGSPTPTAYTLYRGTVHGGPYSVVKSGLTSTSTTDTPPNGTWFYVVAAYVGGIVSNISGSGSVATVTCTASCAFPTSAVLTVGGNSNSGFNVTTNSTGQPNSTTFTFASSTSGTGTGGGAWQTASESAKSNEIQVTVPAALTATLLPASRTFGSFTVGTSSPSQAFTWTNTSGAGGNVTISAEGFGGANPGDFSQTNTCGALPAVKAPGTTCTFNITFTPTAAGSRAATFFVTDNATGSPHTVSMSGTGVSAAPLVNLNPTSLNFGDQTLSTTSTTRSIILTNTGSGTLTITSVVASGDFAVTTVPVTNCGGSLAPLATCSLNVTFTPTATGGRTGAVTVTDNATGSPHVATLSGVGINTKCQMSGNVTLSGAGGVCQ